MQMIDGKTVPNEITHHIIKFRDFLCDSWPAIDQLMEFHSWEEDGNFLDDWIDCNWKLLVGRELLGSSEDLLSMYYSQEPLVSKKNYKVEAKIHDSVHLIDFIKKKSNYNREVLLISGFLARCGLSYGLYPPFDYVKVRSIQGEKIYVVPISKCRFFLTS